MKDPELSSKIEGAGTQIFGGETTGGSLPRKEGVSRKFFKTYLKNVFLCIFKRDIRVSGMVTERKNGANLDI